MKTCTCYPATSKPYFVTLCNSNSEKLAEDVKDLQSAPALLPAPARKKQHRKSNQRLI